VSMEGHVEFRAPGARTLTATIDLPRTTILPEPIREGTLRIALPSIDGLPSGRYNVRAILDFGSDHYIGAERDVDLSRLAAANAPIR